MRALRSLLAAVIALGWAASAEATVLVEVPFDEMARQADAIVIGQVARVGSRMVLLDEGAEPWTVTTVRVDRWLAGSGSPEVRIEERGGTSQRGTMTVAGTPTYRRGERVLLFLRIDDEGRYRTFGMSQGRFVIRTAVPPLSDTVTRDFGDVSFARFGPDGMTLTHLPPQTMPLQMLIDRVLLVRAEPR